MKIKCSKINCVIGHIHTLLENSGRLLEPRIRKSGLRAYDTLLLCTHFTWTQEQADNQPIFYTTSNFAYDAIQNGYNNNDDDDGNDNDNNKPIRGKPRFCTSGFLWQFSGLMPFAWPTG